MDDLDQQVREFLRKHLGWLPDDLPPDADIVNEAKIDGDDIWEFVGQFGKRFGVNTEGFRWYHHGGPEGCNPLWLIFRPWWMRKTHVPIRIADLVVSARSGVWSVQYPESERED